MIILGVQAGQGDIPNSMDPTGLNQEADAEKTAQLEATIEELRNQTATMTTQLLEKESRIEKLVSFFGFFYKGNSAHCCIL